MYHIPHIRHIIPPPSPQDSNENKPLVEIGVGGGIGVRGRGGGLWGSPKGTPEELCGNSRREPAAANPLRSPKELRLFDLLMRLASELPPISIPFG